MAERPLNRHNLPAQDPAEENHEAEQADEDRPEEARSTQYRETLADISTEWGGEDSWRQCPKCSSAMRFSAKGVHCRGCGFFKNVQDASGCDYRDSRDQNSAVFLLCLLKFSYFS